MQIDSAATSQIGGRPVNEDRHLHIAGTAGQLFAVADGLGGHGRGDEASRCVIAALEQLFPTAGQTEEPGALLARLLESAQSSLMELQQHEHCPAAMKTTLCLLLLRGNQAWMAHVGDSRCYFFRGGRLLYCTRDHSLPQLLVDTGDLHRSEIRRHPQRNRLLRVLGVPWDSPQYDLVGPVDLLAGDAFLLCTDGFWEWIEERLMARALKRSANAEEWLQIMDGVVALQAEQSGGTPDNRTAVTLLVE